MLLLLSALLACSGTLELAPNARTPQDTAQPEDSVPLVETGDDTSVPVDTNPPEDTDSDDTAPPEDTGPVYANCAEAGQSAYLVVPGGTFTLRWGETATLQVAGCTTGPFRIGCADARVSGVVTGDLVDQYAGVFAQLEITATAPEGTPGVATYCVMYSGDGGSTTLSPTVE